MSCERNFFLNWKEGEFKHMCVAPLSLGNYSRKKIIHEQTRQHHLTQQDSQGVVQSYSVLFPSDYPKQYSCSVSSLLISLEPTN